MSRKVVPIVFLALASLLIIFGVSLNAIVAKSREHIHDELQKSFGRDVAFGELRLSFWRGPGLSAKDLRIAEDPRFAATPFIQTKELTMHLRWLPLLAGRFEIDKFILEEPEIQIITNETGALNIAALTGHEKKPKGAVEAREKKVPGAPRFSITAVSIRNGSVYYIDRTSREPVEIRLRKVDLDAREAAPGETAKVKMSGGLFEYPGRNVSVEGKVGPRGENPWSRVPLDLQLRCDSLLLPQLTRAIPALRTTLIRHLDAAGPIAVQTKLLGTFERPRLAELNLTGPFFGANSNNTTVKGELDFSSAASWSEGVIKTQIAIDPLPLDQLKTIPFFRETLPASLTFEGPIGVAGEMRGTLADLKIRATVKAEQSEVLYGSWFKKPKGIPAAIELDMERRKDGLIFRESSLTIQNSKLKFSGALDEPGARPLTLSLASDGLDLAGWDKLLPPLSRYNLAGKIRWNLKIKKNLAAEGGLEISGGLVLDDVQAKEKKGGRGIDRATARIVFRGKDARVENFSLRSGSSDISLEGAVADLSQPALRYSLRSARLKLGDLTSAAAFQGDEMRTLAGNGDLQLNDGKMLVRGNVASAEGTLQKMPYRNLRGEAAWSPGVVSFKNLSFQALNGNFRAGGSWETGAENSLKLALDAGIESVDFKTLLSQEFPRFKNHIDGQLNFKARLRGESKNFDELPNSLDGQGETQLKNGSLKDFNLVQLAFSKLSGLPGMSNLRVPARFAALARKKETPFDSLTATFTMKQGRIYSKDLLLSTADYSIGADGSIGLDKTMKFNATLVLSPQFTQELAQEYKNIRYLVDRKGRLTVPFRVEGMLPRIQAKPDLQKLGQQMQKDFVGKGAERATEESDKPAKKNSRRERIQKGLERLFGK
jgi:uncharacterized protein involved in outer membrane biogenesis